MRRPAAQGLGDANQPAIVEALQCAGYTTQSLASVGLGCPDLVVGYAGVNILLEVKNPEAKHGGNPETKRAQKTWHDMWRGQVAVVRTPEEALEVCSAVLVREKTGA